MKKSAKFALFFLLPILFFAFTNYYSNKFNSKKNKFLSIQEAIEKNIISAEFKGAGTYSGDAIKLEVRNLIPIDTMIRIEAGRRLKSEDSTTQDILIVKEIKLFLAANETKQLKLFGFCCQAHNGAPPLNSNFIFFFPAKTFNELTTVLVNNPSSIRS